MMWPNLQRARTFEQVNRARVGVFLFGIVYAAIVPLLVLILGLIVQLLVHRELQSMSLPTGAAASGGSSHVSADSPPMPRQWQLGRIPVDNWPYFGRSDYCLLALVGAGLAASTLLVVSSIGQHRYVHRAATGVSRELKCAIRDQAFVLGTGELVDVHGTRSEDLFTEQVRDVAAAITDWFGAIPRSVVLLLGLVVVALLVDPLLTLLAVLLGLMIWRSYGWLSARTRNAERIWEDRARQRHDLLLEGLLLARVAPTLLQSRRSRTTFVDTLRHYISDVQKSRDASSLRSPLLLYVSLLSAATMLVVVGLGQPPRTMASVAVMASALICAFAPARGLIRLPADLKPGEAAARELFAYLARGPRVMQLSGARVLESLQSGIELDRVTVADVQGKKLLEEISLAVPAGRHVGMVASDSQTLRALVGLFVRYYDPAFGRVLFDSRDIRYVTLDSLRDQAALVRAANILFTGEVRENIDCGDTRYSLLQVTAAAKRAGAYEFIQQLPEGFSTIIGEHGEHLTPTQVFRISLARAMLRDPSLMLIEEPADSGNGAQDQIDQTLSDICKDRTVILLPNRLASLRSLDRIYLFHEGRLHAQGNHAELIRSNELYRHMNYVRFNPFRQSTN